MVAAVGQRVELHPLGISADALLHDYRIRTLGHRRTGHDAHAFPFAHLAVERTAGE